jgi:predicted enzyme related to lactoylglutathione lyase
MHKSKLSTFIIDCRTDDVAQAADFWSRALGRPVLPARPDDDRYRTIQSEAAEPLLMVQRVDHESRVHLDIESDDIEAEVARLEALGAKRLEKIKTWWVMLAPTGQKFCVVKPQRGPIGDEGNRWP